MVTFNLVDTAFAHDKYSVAGKLSKHIAWDRSRSDISLPTFYIHESIYNTDTPKELTYGLLFESKSLIPHIYSNAHLVADKFHKIFTYDQELIDHNPEVFHLCPAGGIWIGGTTGMGELGIKEKTKNCSLVSSNKIHCSLHNFRHRLANHIKDYPSVDVYGPMMGHDWITTCETVNNYRYSIVIENNRTKNYFTEKLLNCFAVGTVPIYLGCTNIGEYFDTNGIIEIDEQCNFDRLLGRLSEEDYNSRIESISENYKKCLRFEIIEDYIYNRYFNTDEK